MVAFLRDKPSSCITKVPSGTVAVAFVVQLLMSKEAMVVSPVTRSKRVLKVAVGTHVISCPIKSRSEGIWLYPLFCLVLHERKCICSYYLRTSRKNVMLFSYRHEFSQSG